MGVGILPNQGCENYIYYRLCSTEIISFVVSVCLSAHIRRCCNFWTSLTPLYPIDLYRQCRSNVWVKQVIWVIFPWECMKPFGKWISNAGSIQKKGKFRCNLSHFPFYWDISKEDLLVFYAELQWHCSTNTGIHNTILDMNVKAPNHHDTRCYYNAGHCNCSILTPMQLMIMWATPLIHLYYWVECWKVLCQIAL